MATTGRVGSLSLMSDTLRDVGNTQVRLGQLQNQISSGFKSNDYAGLNGSVEQFTQVSGQIDRALQFNTNNQLNISKLQTADGALAKIYDISDQMKVAIMGASGSALKSSNLGQVITDLLKSFGGELNATFNGYYIFGGTDTINAPVPDTSRPNAAVGIPDDTYYTGSKQNATLRADDRTEVPFPARADDPAFQKLYAAAHQAIQAATANDTNLLFQAQLQMQSGISDLSAVRSRVGSTVVNIQAIDDRLKSLKTYWTQLTDSVSKTDIVAASTEVSGYQSILQASFQIYSRLSQLRLSDYLK